MNQEYVHVLLFQLFADRTDTAFCLRSAGALLFAGSTRFTFSAHSRLSVSNLGNRARQFRDLLKNRNIGQFGGPDYAQRFRRVNFCVYTPLLAGRTYAEGSNDTAIVDAQDSATNGE